MPLDLPLETQRLFLRAFREQDLAAFVAYRSDPEVARYQSWDAPYSAARAQCFLREMEATTLGAPDSWYQVAIELKENGELIGDCALCVMAEKPQQAEVGITLASAHQGRGYAREAVEKLLEYLFTGLCLDRVCANCDTRNVRSALLLERLGMEKTGPPQRARYKGAWCEEQWYALCRDRWQNPAQPAHSVE